MTNFFNDIFKDLDNLETSLLGPDYKYFTYIKSPSELGISSKGSISALGNDVTGLVKYMDTLVTGGGAQKGGKDPLGDRFFLKTGAKCSDVSTGDQVTRSIYVDNIPNGDIPFITEGLNTNLSSFEGIIPGSMQSAFNINPLLMFQAFMEGTDPSCAAVSLPVRDTNNVTSLETKYLTLSDIGNVEPCLFNGSKNPISGIQKDSSTCGRLQGGGQLLEGFDNLNKINNCDKNINLIFKVSVCLLVLIVLVKVFNKK